MRKLLLLVLLALLAAALPLTDCAAQTARSRVPAWVAISPDLDEAGTGFRLARFAGETPRDVILLALTADAATLTQAVEALLAARRAGGDAPASDALLRVHHPARSPARVLPWARRVVEDVRAAAPRHIPGVGRVRAVQIWLPAQQRGDRGFGPSR